MNNLLIKDSGLFSRLFRPIASWWNKDSIRISPREGRLLRLQPSCILRIDDCEMMINRREVHDQADGAKVFYVGHVINDGRKCALQVVVGETHATWFIDDCVHSIQLKEVVVFEPTDRYRNSRNRARI